MNKGTALKGKNYIGKGTILSGVELGFGSYVSNYGDISYTKIGKYTSIGPYVRTVLGRHPVSDYAALHPAFYSGVGQMGFTYVNKNGGYHSDTNGASKKNRTETEARRIRNSNSPEVFSEEIYSDEGKRYRILIGNDVWIGEGVNILEGVRIGDGAVIGAGAVVTKDVEPYSINVGVPARKLRERFDRETAEELLRLCWWEKEEGWIREHITDFQDAKQLIRVLSAENQK